MVCGLLLRAFPTERSARAEGDHTQRGTRHFPPARCGFCGFSFGFGPGSDLDAKEKEKEKEQKEKKETFPSGSANSLRAERRRPQREEGEEKTTAAGALIVLPSEGVLCSAGDFSSIARKQSCPHKTKAAQSRGGSLVAPLSSLPNVLTREKKVKRTTCCFCSRSTTTTASDKVSLLSLLLSSGQLACNLSLLQASLAGPARLSSEAIRHTNRRTQERRS